MTDDAHDGGSRSGREILAATWDQLALLVGFSYLIAVTVEYPDSARQFPLVFLVAGFCFLAVQFVSELLPPVYGRRIKTLTQGMANEMDVEDIEDDADAPEDERHDETKVEPVLTSRRARLVGIAYLVGFIYAVPVVILGSVGLLGYRDWQTGVIATVIVTTAIYLLFGRVLNVPVAEGIYEIPILGGLL
jgi:hypothetical protein